jgi:hypothetical protein
MIDREPRIHEALDRLAPGETDEHADWSDAMRRAGIRPARRRAVVAATAFAAAIVLLAATPLGSAVVRGVDGFSAWLTGEPGTRAPEPVQQELVDADRSSWAAFPTTPEVRELIRARIDGAAYTLYGFRAGAAVCLRLTVRGIRGAGPTLACASVSELRSSRDLLIPVKGNVGLGRVGPLPRDADDPATVPRALATFGFAASEVSDVRVVSDEGPRQAMLAGAAFLHVLPRPARGTWVRRAVAVTPGGRRQTVPIAVFARGEPTEIPVRSPKGPSRIERKVSGGTIGWFVRREARGAPIVGSNVRLGTCCTVGQFARLIQPDPQDFLRMLVAENDLGEGTEVCYYLVTRGGAGGTCSPLARLFERGPLAVSWGFSGAGQQSWIASGFASDDVAARHDRVRDRRAPPGSPRRQRRDRTAPRGQAPGEGRGVRPCGPRRRRRDDPAALSSSALNARATRANDRVTIVTGSAATLRRWRLRKGWRVEAFARRKRSSSPPSGVG